MFCVSVSTILILIVLLLVSYDLRFLLGELPSWDTLTRPESGYKDKVQFHRLSVRITLPVKGLHSREGDYWCVFSLLSNVRCFPHVDLPSFIYPSSSRYPPSRIEDLPRGVPGGSGPLWSVWLLTRLTSRPTRHVPLRLNHTRRTLHHVPPIRKEDDVCVVVTPNVSSTVGGLSVLKGTTWVDATRDLSKTNKTKDVRKAPVYILLSNS